MQKRYPSPRILLPILVGGIALALWHNIVDGTRGDMPVVFWAFFGTLILLSGAACIAGARNRIQGRMQGIVCAGAIYGIALTGWKYAGIAIFLAAMLWLASAYRSLPPANQKQTVR